MDRELRDKYDLLLNSLKKLDGLAIAFSGGVDSAFLLYAAHEALDKKVIALTVNSPYIPDWEISEAEKFARDKNIEHQTIDLPIPDQILNNPGDRCYLCKTLLFTSLIDYARENGYKSIADGTNADDSNSHRPGIKALRELKVLSPLQDAGFTKSDIRKMSKELGLYTWEKPAYACLLTRIPYNSRIDKDILRRIERSETFLIELGIKAVRVRTHGNLARIETEPRYIDKIFRENLMEKISKQLRRYGFSFVTLDLEGYRTGGIDEILKEKNHDRKR
jgi:uncharacterized protein